MKKTDHVDLLIEIGRTAELFHTPDGEAFSDVVIGGHRETWRVRSEKFGSWLRHQFFVKHKKACSGGAVRTAIDTLAAIAQWEKGEREFQHRNSRAAS
jgi:hypothetical protein